MRSLDESREVLYVIRTLDVLMGSGVGLEAAIHSISQGGYGIIYKDFSNLMDYINIGKPLELSQKYSQTLPNLHEPLKVL